MFLATSVQKNVELDHDKYECKYQKFRRKNAKKKYRRFINCHSDKMMR